MLRLVLDTHVRLDWLVFDDKDTAPIRNAVAQKSLGGMVNGAGLLPVIPLP